jgi:hypothetical protein
MNQWATHPIDGVSRRDDPMPVRIEKDRRIW